MPFFPFDPPHALREKRPLYRSRPALLKPSASTPYLTTRMEVETSRLAQAARLVVATRSDRAEVAALLLKWIRNVVTLLRDPVELNVQKLRFACIARYQSISHAKSFSLSQQSCTSRERSAVKENGIKMPLLMQAPRLAVVTRDRPR